MSNSFFQFQQFRIEQSNSAMKVGVDSLALGCWTSVLQTDSILDIGCGTGLLSLIMAQRNPKARILGIDIDDGALLDANLNVNLSKWKSQIEIKHISLQALAKENSLKFNLVISNPPYFNSAHACSDSRRTLARHDKKLNMHELINDSLKLLKVNGKMSIIYPSDRVDRLISYGEGLGLSVSRICKLIPIEGKSSHRTMVELTKYTTATLKAESLTIRNRTGEYTSSYKELTSDFYL
ncbi:MAG: tRNA1(Val) (adenine(37)-N6)-methyltransferase [Bacteroidales bacterium]